MKKRIFIIHGWGGVANEGWLGWLKEELELSGYLVFSLQMPKTNEPRIGAWVQTVADAVGTIDTNTFFVGHSMGCQTIARYLSELSSKEASGGVIFVAGFFKKLTNMGNDELSIDIIKEWLDTPIDLINVKRHVLKSLAIFSDNDPYVPMENVDDFKNILESKIVIEKKQEHFSGSYGLQKYPRILEHIKNFIGN